MQLQTDNKITGLCCNVKAKTCHGCGYPSGSECRAVIGSFYGVCYHYGTITIVCFLSIYLWRSIMQKRSLWPKLNRYEGCVISSLNNFVTLIIVWIYGCTIIFKIYVFLILHFFLICIYVFIFIYFYFIIKLYVYIIMRRECFLLFSLQAEIQKYIAEVRNTHTHICFSHIYLWEDFHWLPFIFYSFVHPNLNPKANLTSVPTLPLNSSFFPINYW